MTAIQSMMHWCVLVHSGGIVYKSKFEPCSLQAHKFLLH
jgi:hypothetical protein